MSQEDPNIHTLFRVEDCDLKRGGTKNKYQSKKGFASVQPYSNEKSISQIFEEAKTLPNMVLFKQFLIDNMISVELLKSSSYLCSLLP